MRFSPLSVLLASIASTQAVLNGHCTGGGLANGVGVCISTSSCRASGGTVHNGLCPFDPENIKCCTKAPCTSASLGGGVCRFTDSCTGNHYPIPGLCPGGSNFQCCAPCAPAGAKRDEVGGLDKRLPIC